MEGERERERIQFTDCCYALCWQPLHSFVVEFCILLVLTYSLSSPSLGVLKLLLGATGCRCVATTVVPQAFPDYWELCVSWASRSMQPLPPPWVVTCSVKSSSSCDLSRGKGQAGANEGDAGARFMDNGGPASQAAFTSARKARRMSSRRGGHAELRLEGVEHELDRCARELQGSWELGRPAYPILLMTV